MGWNNVFHCEWNEFGKRVLKYYWPEAISYDDITKTDFTIHRGRIDILTGGFPCQPYSAAGKRLGKEDDRHLWPEMLRAIREIQPRWIVGENVRGLVSWNGGMVFDEVQADLEAEGYQVTPFLLPAAGVNAPHKRERVWFIAKNTNKNGRGGNERKSESSEWKQRDIGAGDNERLHTNYEKAGATSNTTGSRRKEQQQDNGRQNTTENRSGLDDRPERLGENGNASDPDCILGREGGLYKAQREKAERYAGSRDAPGYGGTGWNNFPTQPPVCNGDDGLSSELDGITFSKWRKESIKAGGNAIVPQVALQIFKSIQEYERLHD